LKCSKQALDGKPPYGFIQERIDQGDDYVDPKKGSRPVHFTKVMKKFQLTREVVENEVSRLQIPFDTEHFVEPESKRGRPKKDGPILMPMPKSKKASKNISVELPEDMSSLSGSEDDSSSKKSKLAEKEQKRAEKEEAEELKRIEKETARKAKEEAEELKRIEKETARKAKEVARKDAEKTKEEIKLMGKEDANSKKFEKVTKRAATMKEKKEKKEKKETKVELPAKELEQEEEQITPPAKTPVQDEVKIATPAKEQEEQIYELQGSPSPSKQEEQLAELLLQEEEEEEDQIQYATQPKKTFDVIIQGVAYLFQNGFIFHKDKSNTYAGTYNLETKEFQFDEDDEEVDEEDDDEEEDEVSSQTEDENDNDDA
jgi:hypothetical protein